MIRLLDVDQENWRKPLSVREDQKHFVADMTCILARAWAYRSDHSAPKMIYDDDTPVGMLLYYDWPEGGMYVFSQLFIDRNWQGMGFGRQAAKLALDEMHTIGRYDKVGLCYVEGDEPARKLYESLGFVHNGESDGDEIEMVLEKL